MNPRRLRNRALRNALYRSTDGRCAICGEPLPDNWHADHIEPWALTHRTNVHEMQPLCPQCNQRKGATVSHVPRPFQTEMANRALELAQAGLKVLVADVHPGSGKTEGYLLAALSLWMDGHIEQIAVFTPRLNLAIQAELDWSRLRATMSGRTFGPITRRPNDTPLLKAVKGGEMAFGYSTTYGSLMALPKLHFDFADLRKTLVIFDEAQQLGDDEAFPGQGTKSARVARELAARAAFTFVLSGTPYRTDGNPLILATYREPDDEGFRELESDVRADYLKGVAEGYLCEFEATLHDGRGIWEYLGEEPETLELSTMEKGLGKVLRQRGYWEPLVERFVDKLRDYQAEVHPETCGLIAAADQKHAVEIINYLRQAHREMRVLLAVSDELAAQDNLRRFQQDEADILVTVAMAHVGFDHQPIKVILPLTTVRSEAWLRQLFARGLRMWTNATGWRIEREEDRGPQVCWIIAPDDPAMAEMIEKLRAESRAGVREREEKATRCSPNESPSQPRIGWGSCGELTGIRATGFAPDGDTGSNEYQYLQQLRAIHRIPRSVPDTRLTALLKEYAGVGGATGGGVPPPPPPRSDFRTAKEEEKEKRSLLRRVAADFDKYMMRHEPTWRYGWAYAEAKRYFGSGVEECGYDDLDTRIAWFKTEMVGRRKFYEG